LMRRGLHGHRAQQMLTLRSKSISVSETTEKSALTKMHLKLASVVQICDAKRLKARPKKYSDEGKVKGKVITP